MNKMNALKDVKPSLKWREIQNGLTERLKNYKFPNELQQPSSDSDIQDSDGEMDMFFFEMDEDIQNQPNTEKKEEVSPRSVMEIVTPPVEAFVPVEDSKDKKSLYATPVFSYEKLVPKPLVVQVPVVSPPNEILDSLFEPIPFIPLPVNRSLLTLLLDSHANSSCVKEEKKPMLVLKQDNEAPFSYSDSDFSDLEYVNNGDVAHLDDSMVGSLSYSIGIRDESYHSNASSLLAEGYWTKASSVSSENSIGSDMMFRLSI